jgi:hypothetical protein
VVATTDRVFSRLSYDSGCWTWTGAKDKHGYGRISRKRDPGTQLVHRIVYQALVRDLQQSEVLDHLCRNTLCCNPMHMEPVSMRENIDRGASKASHATCKMGHEYTPENTLVTKGAPGKQKRVCRTCKAAWTKKHDAKRRVY